MMRRHLLILIALSGLAQFGCSESTNDMPRGLEHREGLVIGTGTVVYETIEGGFYAIRGDDGVLYDPIDLPDAFEQNGLRVRYTLEVLEDVLSFHMVGPIVKVIDIAVLSCQSHESLEQRSGLVC